MITISNKVTVSILVLLFGLFIYSPAMAIPSLQLDIEKGTYDSGTTYNQESVFELYALLIRKPDGLNLLRHKYIISASITPRQGEVYDADFGSITFGSELLDKNTMNYGAPLGSGGGQLPSQGIFPTYYWEHAFTFDRYEYSKAYNVSKVIGTHTGPEPWVQGQTRKMFYKEFNFDVSNLKAGYGIHFDLYNVDSENCIVGKAPSSHDAEGKKVPEPSTLLLLGFGLMGLPLFGRKKR